jgi:hypothetical protein
LISIYPYFMYILFFLFFSFFFTYCLYIYIILSPLFSNCFSLLFFFFFSFFSHYLLLFYSPQGNTERLLQYLMLVFDSSIRISYVHLSLYNNMSQAFLSHLCIVVHGFERSFLGFCRIWLQAGFFIAWFDSYKIG